MSVRSFTSAVVLLSQYSARDRRTKSGLHMEDSMRTMNKAILTAACVVVLVWPLLFWGKPVSPKDNAMSYQQERASNINWRHELLW